MGLGQIISTDLPQQTDKYNLNVTGNTQGAISLTRK